MPMLRILNMSSPNNRSRCQHSEICDERSEECQMTLNEIPQSKAETQTLDENSIIVPDTTKSFFSPGLLRAVTSIVIWHYDRAILCEKSFVFEFRPIYSFLKRTSCQQTAYGLKIQQFIIIRHMVS
jgi:hypothetical protein